MRRLAALLALLCGPVQADTPLLPPADYATTTSGVTVTASYAENTTRITTAEVNWTIPLWLRFVYPSPDGRAVLALADSGNLIGTADPDQIVLTLYLAADPDPLQAALAGLMDPAAMSPTMSGYVWMADLIWENGGWTLTLTDGGVIRIDPVSGIFTRQ